MRRPPLDPDEIPDDTTAGELAGWVAEDIARTVARWVATLVAVVTLATGLLSESADPVIKGICVAVGATGVLAILGGQLFRWSREPQWWAIAITTVAGVLLLAAVWAGSR